MDDLKITDASGDEWTTTTAEFASANAEDKEMVELVAALPVGRTVTVGEWCGNPTQVTRIAAAS